jgi:hypothetical protein
MFPNANKHGKDVFITSTTLATEKFVTLFNTVSFAAPQKYCAGGAWDRTQDSCDYRIGCQMVLPLG